MLILEGEPVPKERPRRGKGNVWYTPRTTLSYENAIGFVVKGSKIKCGSNPVIVSAWFYCNSGKRGDLDNLLKSLIDGAMKGGAFKDDKQVVEIHGYRYDGQENPRVEFEIKELR